MPCGDPRPTPAFPQPAPQTTNPGLRTVPPTRTTSAATFPPVSACSGTPSLTSRASHGERRSRHQQRVPGQGGRRAAFEGDLRHRARRGTGEADRRPRRLRPRQRRARGHLIRLAEAPVRSQDAAREDRPRGRGHAAGRLVPDLPQCPARAAARPGPDPRAAGARRTAHRSGTPGGVPRVPPGPHRRARARRRHRRRIRPPVRPDPFFYRKRHITNGVDVTPGPPHRCSGSGPRTARPPSTGMTAPVPRETAVDSRSLRALRLLTSAHADRAPQ